MRRISFSFYQERARRVVGARREALDRMGLPTDGRPLPGELILLLLHALESHGPRSGPLELADEWLDHLTSHRNELGIALENLTLGIGPPTSGEFNNDAWGECAGGIELAQAVGLLCPGDPTGAAPRAAEAASVSHFAAALEAARFFAAAVAEAFTAADLRSCLRVGLRQMTSGTRAASCVAEALAASGRDRDWHRTWAAIASDWGHPEPTDALVNLAGSILALTVGDLDWRRTLEVILATGGDAHAKAFACATLLGALGADIGGAARGRKRSGRKPGGGSSAGESPAARSLRGIEPPGDDRDLVERLSRLVVACARPEEVEITGAPYVPSVGPPVAGPARLFARYEGEPVLAPDEERAVFLECSDPAKEIPGTLTVEAGERLEALPLGGVVVPGKIAARAVNVRLTGKPGRPGVVRAEVRRTGRTAAVARFGFRRASRYVALGPFDNADGKGLDRAYLPEARLDERLAAGKVQFQKKVLRVGGDRVDTDAAFGSAGPRVIYLLRAVHSPRDLRVALRIGSSDGVKLWLNGRKLLADHVHRHGSPEDYVVPANLKKGLNRIAVKLARCGRSSVFRLRVTELNSEKPVLDLWDKF